MLDGGEQLLSPLKFGRLCRLSWSSAGSPCSCAPSGLVSVLCRLVYKIVGNTVFISRNSQIFRVNMYPNFNERFSKVYVTKWCGDLMMN